MPVEDTIFVIKSHYIFMIVKEVSFLDYQQSPRKILSILGDRYCNHMPHWVIKLIFALDYYFSFSLSTCIFEMDADSEGRTPLHWAVDRGHLNVTELLIGRNADVNAKVFINI